MLSCSSEDSAVNIPNNMQINVVINTEIVGTTSSMPNGNGSGTVKFDISPNSGVSYKMVFGDGETIETKKGIFTNNYRVSGTKTYEIKVTAFNGLK